MPKAFPFYEKVSHRHEWSVWTTCRQLWALSPLVLSACRYYTKRIRSRTLECLIADDEHRNDLGKTFAMSVPSGLQTGAYQDDDCELQIGCPYPHDVFGSFIRAEGEWSVTNDKINFLMTTEDAVIVSGTSKKSPEQLIAIAIAGPTSSPFIPTSPAYYITCVVVARSHRRRGIGRRIVCEVMRICEERG